jgi:hypothetical protein
MLRHWYGGSSKRNEDAGEEPRYAMTAWTASTRMMAKVRRLFSATLGVDIDVKTPMNSPTLANYA